MPAGMVVWWDLVPREQWGWRFPDVPVPQELLQLEDRLGSVSRGAVQNTIERFTFPHKYKKVSAPKPRHSCQPLSVSQGLWARSRQKEGLRWVTVLRVGKLAPSTQTSPEAGEECKTQQWCFNILRGSRGGSGGVAQLAVSHF